ncbi:MAG: hypothetical protein ACD_63C00108G0008 [uncultured bacterium]|nr:MAG: hypothetical protein ACD_63C00108G0008 [uncultured bacterium]
MPIKSYRPTTPSRRFITTVDFSNVSKNEPHKALTKGKKSGSGRGTDGKLSVRHKGGGHKRKYRQIDFRRDKYDIPARVESVEYDPNRSAFISLVVYKDGERRYIIAPEGLTEKQEVISSQKKLPAAVGNRMPLEHIPDGASVYNVEMTPGKGAQMIRSAGSMAQVMTREGKYVQLKLPSGEIRIFFKKCMATIGQVSNVDHENIVIGKAGRRRWFGVRPAVVGTAMNRVDHPHGGGEGHTSLGMRRGPRTKWGKPAFGVKTRKKRRRSNKLIVKRRHKRHKG